MAVKTPHAVLVALGVALIAVGALWGLLMAVALAWSGLVVAGGVWTILRFRRARAEIRAALEQAGYEVMHMSHRYLRLGPFSVWNTSRLQYVFHIQVRETVGRQRTAWARWGRTWLTSPDTLELNWEK